MSTQPLTHCVVCLVNKLTLAELAHSPCKHCHVEFCTECITTAFAIAEKDDICEVFCPNPHCKKPLNADCMQIKASNIKNWVHQELTHPKYGVLTDFKNWTAQDLVTFILNQRHRDLNELRRKSSIWEEEIDALKLRAKNTDLNDVPLRPKLLTNQSQDRIELRSKFRPKSDAGLTRSQSAHSLSTAYRNNPLKQHKHKIPLFATSAVNYDDDSDVHTDDDFSDTGSEDLLRSCTTVHRRGLTLGLDAIIDEDEELHEYECDYQSPVSTLCNSMHTQTRDSSTMLSIQSPTDTTDTIDTIETISNKSRLSFKSLFGDAGSPKKRINRQRTHSEHVPPQKQPVVLHKRSGSNRIYNPFKKYKYKKHKKKQPKLQQTKSLRGLGHKKSFTLNENRATTPDPLQGRDRSTSEKKGMPLPSQNVLGVGQLGDMLSRSVPVEARPMHQSPCVDLKIHTTTLVVQLKPPQTTPSSVSTVNTPISELSAENNVGDSPPPKSSPALQNYNTSTKSGTFSNGINGLTLAPIHSARELNDGYPQLIDNSTVISDHTPSNKEEVEEEEDDNGNDHTSESSFEIQSDTEEEMHDINVEDVEDIDELRDIPKTFTTANNTQTNTNTNTNTNTMVMPIPNEAFPARINTAPQIQTNGMLIDIHEDIGGDDKKSESATPDTPPTPESPNSASMESGSHYERVMRNLENFATVKQTQTQTQEIIGNDPSQNISNNAYNIRNKSPEPPEMEPGCTGCQACIIL